MHKMRPNRDDGEHTSEKSQEGPALVRPIVTAERCAPHVENHLVVHWLSPFFTPSSGWWPAWLVFQSKDLFDPGEMQCNRIGPCGRGEMLLIKRVGLLYERQSLNRIAQDAGDLCNREQHLRFGFVSSADLHLAENGQAHWRATSQRSTLEGILDRRRCNTASRMASTSKTIKERGSMMYSRSRTTSGASPPRAASPSSLPRPKAVDL